MPPNFKVRSLRHLTVLNLSWFFHMVSSRVARMRRIQKKLKIKEEAFTLAKEYLKDITECVPAAMLEEFTENLQDIILRETSILDFKYYEGISCLLNSSTKVLRLKKPKLFQDSSLALEIFLSRLELATKLTELHIVKSVTELVDFDFSDSLEIIGRCQCLNILILQGLKSVEISSDAMFDFLQTLENNCGRNLVHLDLSDSNCDDLGCQIIQDMVNLRILLLNHCNKITTKAMVSLLRNLSSLNRIEANRGSESGVQNAMSALRTHPDHDEQLPMGRFENLQEFLFRNVFKGITKVTDLCPNIRNVKIIHNVFEHSYDAKIDDQLKDLVKINGFKEQELKVELDIYCYNMLFAIQMRNLKDYGSRIIKISLTESEFVHPQTLNPLALRCPNLEVLGLINPTVVTDELFVGEVPELAAEPFRSLKSLTFESDFISVGLGKFLLKSSTSLEYLLLSLTTFDAKMTEILNFLVDHPRNRLETMILVFETVQVEDFTDQLFKIFESSPSLIKSEIIVRRGNSELKESFQKLRAKVKFMNWDLKLTLSINHILRN